MNENLIIQREVIREVIMNKKKIYYFTLRMPTNMMEIVKKRSKKISRSLNSYIVELLKKDIEKKNSVDEYIEQLESIHRDDTG